MLFGLKSLRIEELKIGTNVFNLMLYSNNARCFPLLMLISKVSVSFTVRLLTLLIEMSELLLGEEG